MQKFTYKGYSVEVFNTYNGNVMYVSNTQGETVWAHKFTGEAIDQAKRVIDAQ